MTEKKEVTSQSGPLLFDVTQEEIDAVAHVPNVLYRNCKFGDVTFKSSVYLIDCNWSSLSASAPFVIHLTPDIIPQTAYGRNWGRVRHHQKGSGQFLDLEKIPPKALRYVTQAEIDQALGPKKVWFNCCFDKVVFSKNRHTVKESCWNFVTCEGKSCKVKLHPDILTKSTHDYLVKKEGDISIVHNASVLESYEANLSEDSKFYCQHQRVEFYNSTVLCPIMFEGGMQGEVWMDEATKANSAAAFPLKIINGSLVSY